MPASKEDTGRDLAEWMGCHRCPRFTNKNDAIDWLRGHGFVFSWASWLERIHANGGRPLYGDKPAPAPTKRAAASSQTCGATREFPACRRRQHQTR